MKVIVTQRCSIQPSFASKVDPGHVFYGVSSISTDGTPKGWSRLIGSNGVPFLLPTEAFRVEGAHDAGGRSAERPTFHGVMVSGARKARGAAKESRVNAYVADRACR